MLKSTTSGPTCHLGLMMKNVYSIGASGQPAGFPPRHFLRRPHAPAETLSPENPDRRQTLLRVSTSTTSMPGRPQPRRLRLRAGRDHQPRAASCSRFWNLFKTLSGIVINNDLLERKYVYDSSQRPFSSLRKRRNKTDTSSGEYKSSVSSEISLAPSISPRARWCHPVGNAW